jgi:LytR cell envelope-related transcriptional attenuator
MARPDERGIALSSPLALLSAGVVLVAGAAFLFTGNDPAPADTARTVTATPSTTPTTPPPAPEPVVEKKKKPKKQKPVIHRARTYVEVYNNSGISGLAGQVAGRAGSAGWQVVGSDNWYGTIPASTVYFPARLEAQAKLLGRDLGINRLRPAIAPMRFDRLTVILTG